MAIEARPKDIRHSYRESARRRTVRVARRYWGTPFGETVNEPQLPPAWLSTTR